jgi:lipopolysaccharide export system protein LptA
MRARAFAFALAACLVFATAHAKQSDSSQPVQVNADHSLMSQDNELLTLTGNVRIDQGTMHLDGARAVGHFDQDNKLEHAVLTGSPAHMHQQMDDGSMVHGQSDTIDYTVSNNTIVLTGDASVVHEGQGEFHGAKLTYNTDTGQIVGEGGPGGQVHMILQPQKKSAPAHKPAASPSSTPAPATPAPATSAPVPAKPAPAASTPAPASTTHG